MWNESTLASVSMGYQVGVTALQMATTVSTVANGGELRQPRIVKAQVNADGTVTPVPPRVMRRVIQQSTAEQLTTIMEQVVERGTATAAKIPGYTIAGKTGTSAKLENGRYSKSDYNASFVGFIPSRNPALAIIVVIDSPHGHGYYGGVVSAPVFKRIGERAMQYLGIAPNLEPSRVLLAARHDPVEPARPAPVKAVMPVPASPSATRPDNDLVPDVIGLSAREAIRVLARVGITPRVSGDGVVVQQEPRAGSPLERGMACTLALGRPAVSVPVVSDQRQ
jgi:membrane peptidoglycan carboxypeptidase